METVPIEDVEPNSLPSGSDRRSLSTALGATDVAINFYRIAPTEGFPGGLHAHADQEEIFIVIEGEATFETLPPRRGGDREDEAEPPSAPEGTEVVVREGEAIRFAPGEYQSGRNDAEDELLALAIGAPPDSEDVRIPVECPDCGHPDLRLEANESLTFVCPDCGSDYAPQPCPDCGGDLRVTLGADQRTVVVCRTCRADFERPPLSR